MFNFDNNIKIFVSIISLMIIYLIFFEPIFYSDKFNNFILKFSLYFIVVTFTGIFEFSFISGRGQYFLLFLFNIIISRFIYYKFFKFRLNFLVFLIALISIFVNLLLPLKLI